MEPSKLAGQAIHTVESFFDRLMLSYKHRFNRFTKLRVVPYDGHGTRDRIGMRGRVLDDRRPGDPGAETTVLENLVDAVRRIDSDDVPNAEVRVRVGDAVVETTTDEDGYYLVDVDGGADGWPSGWHEVGVEVLDPPKTDREPVRATGRVLVPPADVDIAVVSDMDDTVVHTGATDLLRHARSVLLTSARGRVPFAGVGAFYRALVAGCREGVERPLFYVSSSPWNLYEYFTGFLRVHDIPVGPIFLKDFGFTREKLLKEGHRTHKLDHVRRLMDLYPGLGFVLVGDSGQHDPEIYREIVRERPGRVRVVYMRDVTKRARDREVRAIADEVEEAGAPMVFADTTVDIARHAADLGLVPARAVDEVRRHSD